MYTNKLMFDRIIMTDIDIVIFFDTKDVHSKIKTDILCQGNILTVQIHNQLLSNLFMLS